MFLCFRVAAAGIFVLLIIITVIMVFWPRKTKEEELAGSGTKKVCLGRAVVFVLFGSLKKRHICYQALLPFIYPLLPTSKTLLFIGYHLSQREPYSFNL